MSIVQKYLWNCVIIFTFFHFNAFHLEQIPESEDLLLELPDQFGIGILVDNSLADNLFGSVGIPKM